ncbi:chymotrypsin-like elastase family member 2A [Genypterus blacodes]|uniref:chymotrypsin-like elastase family member 2A n=1 Tax=Genypterus blacodes TaxID=154954 RepID=UPI003F772BF9
MIRLVAFLSCFGLICAEAPFNHNVHNQRVIGGHDAEPNTWKWQVSFQRVTSHDENSFYHICGGTILDGFHIMTAAHCVNSMDASQYRVVVGEYDLFENDGSEEFLRVNKIIVHPSWTGNVARGNDIAILRLADPIYDNGFVSLADLPALDETMPHGFQCHITGWGLMDMDGSVPAILQVAAINVVEHSVCSQPDWWGSIADTMVCAGGDGIISGCQGDSGGPLNCFTDGAWRVHGIVSYGPYNCNMKNKPTVFTKVSSFMDWIYTVLLEFRP